VVRRLFNRSRNSSKEGDWKRFRETQRAYKKAIVIAKRNSWREFCEGIEKVPEALRLHRILSQENKIYLGCIKFSSGGYTECMCTSPVLGGLPVARVGDLCLGEAIAQGVETSGKSGVSKWCGMAITTFEPYNVPGTARIYPILLQEGLKYLVRPLTKIFRASIALRHVSQVCKILK
jgi:hypothetical protein